MKVRAKIKSSFCANEKFDEVNKRFIRWKLRLIKKQIKQILSVSKTNMVKKLDVLFDGYTQI